MKKLAGGEKPDAVLNDGDTAVVKKIRRKSTDGYYLSIEYHEYKYHIKSGEGQAAIQYGPFNLAAGGPTYGQYVDAKDYRKFIETYRRVQRTFTGPGFKVLLNQVGIDKDQLVSQFMATPDVQATIQALFDKYDWIVGD